MYAILKEVTAVNKSQFHAKYDTFPEPLLLQTAKGRWLSNPAADNLCLSQIDYDNLAKWDDHSSIWLAGRFFYVHGHRTSEGLFLLLHADAFLSSASLNLSSQLRQRLTSAFNGMSNLKDHLSGDQDAAKEDVAAIDLALHQILRMVTELERCSESELFCKKVRLDLNKWLRRLGDEMIQCCATSKGVTLHISLPHDHLTAAADPHLLDYMVTHLVSNAIKTAYGEKVDVFLTLSKEAENEQADITISANGAGLSPSVLTNPLWNQPTRLLAGRGLGLGLPIAQSIAALHGGRLVVPDTKGSNGSQVVVSLPLTIPEGFLDSSASTIEPEGGLSIARILLSDILTSAAFHPDREPKE